MDWIHLAQCRAHLRTHVNMIINLRSKNFDLRIKLRVNFVSDSGLDSFRSVWGPFADSRKHDNEPSDEEFQFEDYIKIEFCVRGWTGFIWLSVGPICGLT